MVIMGTALQLVRASLVAALAAQGLAYGATLYKSVDSHGRITFSDTPVDGAVVVQRIDSSDSAKAPEGERTPIVLALADTFDEAVAQANARVDMAEHALALARRPIVEDSPLALPSVRLSRTEAQQLEFFKNDVVAARRNLMRVLKQRNWYTVERPLA